jgi:tRNA(Arg) A34 adenosine deaminase TadA
MVAIEDACKNTNNLSLEGCDLYTTLEPCPMCLGAIYWANIANIYFANTVKQAVEVGFDDSFIFEEFLKKPEQRKIPASHVNNPEAIKVLKDWKVLGNDAAQPHP